MAGAKRSFEDGDEFSQEDDANFHTGIADAILSQTSERVNIAGISKKRLKTHGTAQCQNGGSGRGSIESTLLTPSSGADYLSPLSDELLVRILGILALADLLKVAPISRRFHRLADDSQLWKAIYYERFVLPRAMRIPGFRGGSLTSSTRKSAGGAASNAGFYSEQQIIGAQLKRLASGENQPPRPTSSIFAGKQSTASRAEVDATKTCPAGLKLDWKQQYKLRHNWTRGTCAVEELRLSTGGRRSNKRQASSHSSREEEEPMVEDLDGEEAEDGGSGFHRMLVKVVDGIAVTADRKRGLCVWELKPRSLVATGQFSRRMTSTGKGEKATDLVRGVELDQENEYSAPGEPECNGDADIVSTTPASLAINLSRDNLDIATGLIDGGFDIWQHELGPRSLVRRYSHPSSDSGSLTGIAYSHPYVLTATDDGLISLYAFGADLKSSDQKAKHPNELDTLMLNPPQLLTSLRSHTSQPPLALSIRKLPCITIASIAYTFSTRQGWSLGIQDLHVKEVPCGDKAAAIGERTMPAVVATYLAHTLPVAGHRRAALSPGAQRRALDGTLPGNLRTGSPSRALPLAPSSDTLSPISSPPSPVRRRRDSHEEELADDGPTSLCYTHPYLLATMPDNTLILHLCTSNDSALAISPGFRLWGHTSGISDAEITSRGKAVSVSTHGEEMRVWELEGRPAAERGWSVAIRPNPGDGNVNTEPTPDCYWDERRNWVGFDDEMVIVLKEARGGRESLMVYDFS
ncbi:hypothetical protein SEPCBS57363_005387 [Sporothrix epigloea]|uniref:F-box domain-containing protein n=1 Tax=Sporothrix epigloea TaxID=1892477 RepID=A0ABP0DX84_9PEZI